MNNTIEMVEETVKQVWAGKIANIDSDKGLVYLISENVETGEVLEPIHDYTSFGQIAQSVLSRGTGAKFYQILTEDSQKLCEHYCEVPDYLFDNPDVRKHWAEKIDKKYDPKQSTLNMLV